MLPRIFLVVLLIASMGDTCWAKPKKKPQGNSARMTIVEVSPAEITLDAGTAAQETYKFSAATKVTLAGVPVTVDDLRAGMAATITLASDNQTLVTVDAQKAPRVTKKPPPKPVVVWY